MGRLALLLVLALPLAAQSSRITPFEEAKARELLRTQLSCLGCHELDGNGGRVGPSLTGVATRRSATYIRGMIEDPRRVMIATTMPRPRLPAETRELLIRYLAGGARPGDPSEIGTGVARTPPRKKSPIEIYGTWCASCHGHNGSGDGPNAPYLPVPPTKHDDAAKMRERSDDALYDTIANGGAAMGKSPRMPAFGATLTPGEIRTLVRHIRGLCACEGPRWSRDGARE